MHYHKGDAKEAIEMADAILAAVLRLLENQA